MSIFKMVQQEVSIGGMKCDHCAIHVRDALKKIDGVKEAKVNLATNKAIIYSKEGIKEEEIITALNTVEKEFLGVKRIK